MDNLSYYIQQLLTGVSVGGQYALIAIGYTMVYGILRLINFAHGDIFPAVGVKGREQAEPLAHRLSNELGEQRPDLLRRVVGVVQLRREFQRLLRQLVHDLMARRAR